MWHPVIAVFAEILLMYLTVDLPAPKMLTVWICMLVVAFAPGVPL